MVPKFHSYVETATLPNVITVIANAITNLYSTTTRQLNKGASNLKTQNHKRKWSPIITD